MGEAPSRRRIGQPDWRRPIPGLEGYLEPGPTEPEQWAYCESSLEVAVGFTELFWPPFVEIDGLMMRGVDASEPLPESVRQWVSRFHGDLTEVERMINHVHLIDIFGFRLKSMDADALSYLGRVLQDMWSAKLKADFPGYKCKVDLAMGNDVSDWLITFYRVR